MGPTIILDKSAFQSLGRREHPLLHIHFTENLTPILGLELLADLRIEKRDTRTGDEIAQDLARKFGGSGPATNVGFETLCILSLLGQELPDDGRIVPEAAHTGRSSDGSLGAMIGLSALNRGILRWSEGDFGTFEREFAEAWGKATDSLDVDSLVTALSAHHVVIPKAVNLEELRHHVDTLIGTATLQDVWLYWLLAQLSVRPNELSMINARWRRRSGIFLGDFAPYACHCLRVLLTFVGATRHGLIGRSPTNLLDIQYLYYLPFCMVFASDDRVHRALAPILLRPDQSFVKGEDLKADLRRIGDFREGLTERERRFLAFALGSYPPPTVSTVVQGLWRRYAKPWSPRMVNLASTLSEEERKAAIRWVQDMFTKARADDPPRSQ